MTGLPVARLGVASMAVALLLTACGGGSDPAAQTTPEATTTATSPTTTQPVPTTTTASSAPPATGIVITVNDSDYGPMLFDERGQAIYLFDRETTDEPACYGDCAAAWPPVLTDGAPQPMGAARGDLLGTTTRDDGSTQVTYGGHPLYFYANEDPGEVLCHDVDDFGGTWLVVTPEGDAAPA